MSFLNALASNGLSVGLRFYNAKLNSAAKAEEAQRAAVQEAAEETCPAGQAAAPAQSPAARTSPATPLLSPEQMAAGRAEAKARLSSEGSLGRLLAAGQMEEAAARSLSSEEQRQLDELKAREDKIKAEVEASLQKGVPGADSVEYEYQTGPDGRRYISGIKDGQENGEEGAPAQAGPKSSDELSEEERRQVEELKRRDQEVRTHEQAHVAAGAGLAGAPVYEYQNGPDGRRYAIGGHVDLRTSGATDPETALREAETIKRAAMAPAEPSSTDRSVASEAEAKINRLRAEKVSGKGQEDEEGGQDEELKGEPGDSSQAKVHSLKSDSAPLGSALAENFQASRNGDGFGRQALGAYASAKFGSASAYNRPVLARA